MQLKLVLSLIHQRQAEQTWSLYQDDGHLKKEVDHRVNVSVRLVMELPLDLDDCLHSKETLYRIDSVPCNLGPVLAALLSCVALMFHFFWQAANEKGKESSLQRKAHTFFDLIPPLVIDARFSKGCKTMHPAVRFLLFAEP